METRKNSDTMPRSKKIVMVTRIASHGQIPPGATSIFNRSIEVFQKNKNAS
jgi:hypothetical protein